MIDYINKALFSKSNVKKSWKIEVSDGRVFTNENIVTDSIVLEEWLSPDEQLYFGSFRPATFSFTIGNNESASLKGMMIIVSVILDNDTDNPFVIGTYKVDSDNTTTDKSRRDIVAYDLLHDVISANVAEWYNTILPNANSTIQLSAMLSSFLNHFGITSETISWINNITVSKTMETQSLSGGDVLINICEINGGFPIINRDNKFELRRITHFSEGTYPALTLYPSNSTYPGEIHNADANVIDVNSYVPPCKSENYMVQPITRVQIRTDDIDIGSVVGIEGNDYVVENNFLLYGKNASELQTIATNLLNSIKDIVYRPFEVTTYGNPCYEIGDSIQIITPYGAVNSYINSRYMSGGQRLDDNYHATGKEYRTDNVNGTNTQIEQIRGKTNTLERTVDQTVSRVSAIENDYVTESVLTQTANQIRLEVSSVNSDLQGYKTTVTSEFAVKEGEIQARVTATEFSTYKGTVASEFTVKESEIQARVTTTDFNSYKGEVAAEFSVKEGEIQSKVSSSDYNGNTIASMINQTATTVQISASKINLNGYVTVTDLSTSGSTTINGSNITTGTINANLVTVSNLEVGRNVTMGSGATISWGQVTNQPTIPTNTNQLTNGAGFINSSTATSISQYEISTATIRANQIQAGQLSAMTIVGGSIGGSNTSDNIAIGIDSSGWAYLQCASNGTRIAQNTIQTDYIEATSGGATIHVGNYGGTKRLDLHASSKADMKFWFSANQYVTLADLGSAVTESTSHSGYAKNADYAITSGDCDGTATYAGIAYSVTDHSVNSYWGLTATKDNGGVSSDDLIHIGSTWNAVSLAYFNSHESGGGSDRRIKDNIVDVNDKLIDVLDKIQLKNYTLKADQTKSIKCGFIAQEVLEALNECGIDDAEQSIVYKAPTDESTKEIISDGEMYYINYTELLTLLIPAYQNLKKKSKN